MMNILELRLRVSNLNEFGAAGLYVRNAQNRRFILSCSHVVLGTGENLNGFVDQGDTQRWVFVLKKNKKEETVPVYYARCDSNEDVGLVMVKESYKNAYPNGIALGNSIKLDHVQAGDEVFFYSAQSGRRFAGIIESTNATETILYSGDRPVTFTNTIRFGTSSGKNWETISKKGDSGSIIVNAKNEPFGMLIGGTDEFSYAIPLEPILTKLELIVL